MDVEQPGPDEPFDDDVYVPAYWQHAGHVQAGNIQAAAALDWAETGVYGCVLHDDPESAVTLVDRLLDAPGADPGNIARGPLLTLLLERGPEVADDVASTAGNVLAWRQALAQVDLTDQQKAALPGLRGYLPGADPSWHTRPVIGEACRLCDEGRYKEGRRRTRTEGNLVQEELIVRCDTCSHTPMLDGYPD